MLFERLLFSRANVRNRSTSQNIMTRRIWKKSDHRTFEGSERIKVEWRANDGIASCHLLFARRLFILRCVFSFLFIFPFLNHSSDFVARAFAFLLSSPCTLRTSSASSHWPASVVETSWQTVSRAKRKEPSRSFGSRFLLIAANLSRRDSVTVAVAFY